MFVGFKYPEIIRQVALTGTSTLLAWVGDRLDRHFP